jgi:hypothetical protein
MEKPFNFGESPAIHSLRRNAAVLGTTTVALFSANSLAGDHTTVALADTCITLPALPNGIVLPPICYPDQPTPGNETQPTTDPVAEIPTETTTPDTIPPQDTPAPQQPIAPPQSPNSHQPAPQKPAHKPSHDNEQPKTIFDYYRNPLRKIRGLVPFRIDQGVDYKGHGNVFAMGKGVVTVATKHSNYWGNEGGKVVVYRLTDGPAKGKSVFFAESCIPKVHVGQIVTTNTVICYMNGDNAPWAETGWAVSKGKHKDHPAANNVYHKYPDGSQTAYGKNYSRLLHLLGAPAGNSVPPHVSTNPDKVIGKLPGNFPDWLSARV